MFMTGSTGKKGMDLFFLPLPAVSDFLANRLPESLFPGPVPMLNQERL
jgi:hypothetical protein